MCRGEDGKWVPEGKSQVKMRGRRRRRRSPASPAESLASPSESPPSPAERLARARKPSAAEDAAENKSLN